MSWNRFLKCSPQHMHAEMLKKIFKINSFDATFITVRHPFGRMKSEFKWRKKHQTIDLNISYNDWLEETLLLYKNNKFIYDNHIRPQKEFLLPEAKIFKMENGFESVPGWLEDKMNIRFEDKIIPTKMSSKVEKKISEDFTLTNNSKKNLENFYKEDIQFFNF